MGNKQNAITFQQSATALKTALVSAPLVLAALLPAKAKAQTDVMNNVQTEMTNVIPEQNSYSINSFITIARDYIVERGVDEDNNRAINGDRETNMLLAGVAAPSMEEVDIDNIYQKIENSNTEKAFITLMATDNKIQAGYNERILHAHSQVLSGAYNEIINQFNAIANSGRFNLDNIKKILNKGQIKPEDVTILGSYFTNLRGHISHMKYCLNAINEEYKKITGQDFPSIQQKTKLLDIIEWQVLEQKDQLEKGYVPNAQTKYELQKAYERADMICLDASKLKEQYTKQKEKDINFCWKLYKQQQYFLSDEGKNADKHGISKVLLYELIDKISPMTRMFILERAERAYKPVNYPTT